MKSGSQPSIPVALTIATSDSGAGAGIQADLLTFAARRVFGVTALAALTAQSPSEVTAVHAVPAQFLQQQLATLARYFSIGAIKTGMLFNAELIATTAAFLRTTDAPVVVDPVMVATSGARLLEPDAMEVLQTELLPQATLLTPNLDEAALLSGFSIHSPEDMRKAGLTLSARYNCAVLMKGGHMTGDTVCDLLLLADGSEVEWSSKRIDGVNTHGSGCTLSAAIAAELARGIALTDAVANARDYLLETFTQSIRVSGERFSRHI